MFSKTLQTVSLSTGYDIRHNSSVITADFSVSVEAGTFVCLLGSNGAGKSTLLRTIAGLQRPTAGHVLCDGRDTATFSPQQLARQIGVVLTDRQVFDTQITVEELVSMGRMPYTGFLGTLSGDDRRITAQAIAATGMGKFAQRRVNALSDGEQQKVMIAKTLAQQTPIILLDEPTAFLDFPSETYMFRLMRRIAHEERKIVVVATHSLTIALQTADILWVLRRGEKPATGTSHALAEAGTLDTFFEGEGVSFDRAHLSFYIEPDDKHDSMHC